MNTQHDSGSHTIILKCETSQESDLHNIHVDTEIHDNLHIPLSPRIRKSISQIIDIGYQIRNIQFQTFQSDTSLQKKIEKVCREMHQKELETLHNKHENEVTQLVDEKRILQEEKERLETKLECIKSTFEQECTAIAREQSRQVQNSTTNLQNHLQNSIEDMKMKMVKFHSQTASTKTVGNKGEDCIMQYITDHYPMWNVKDTHGEAHAGDFHTYLDENRWILNEVKSHKGSIRTEQVRKFYRDIDTHEPTAAIMFSLYSNIVGKPHGHYEMRGRTHVFFLSHCFSNMNCIQFVHSMCDMLMQRIENECEQDCIDDKSEESALEKLQNTHQAYREKQERMNRTLQRNAEQSVHVMRAQTQYLIGIYEKNIQHDKKKIVELKKRLQEWSTFEQNQYINEDATTNTNHSWKCSSCDICFKTHGQLYKHIVSSAHTKKLSII